MGSFLDKLGFSGKKDSRYTDDFHDEDYVEIPAQGAAKKPGAKIIVRPFIIEEFTDIKAALDALREGYTVCLLNIKPLRDKDLVELKRAINKVKKTCDAVEGDIAGFGEDWIVVTPSFAQIYRGAGAAPEVNMGPAKSTAY